MLNKFLRWLLGPKIASSLGGLFIGAATGAGVAIANGNMDKEAILVGAAGGAASAIAGSTGRVAGEKKAQ